jgi:hypothetical protein
MAPVGTMHRAIKQLGVRVVMVFGLASCTPLKKDTTVCTEYRSLRCATAPECSYDRERECKVCRCSPPGANREGVFHRTGSPDEPGK